MHDHALILHPVDMILQNKVISTTHRQNYTAIVIATLKEIVLPMNTAIWTIKLTGDMFY